MKSGGNSSIPSLKRSRENTHVYRPDQNGRPVKSGGVSTSTTAVGKNEISGLTDIKIKASCPETLRYSSLNDTIILQFGRGIESGDVKRTLGRLTRVTNEVLASLDLNERKSRQNMSGDFRREKKRNGSV